MNRLDDEQDLDQTRPADTSAHADDPRLLAAVQEYMAAIEAGRRPNRQEFLARHPDIAEDLSACLQGLAFVNSAAARINAADDAASNTTHSELTGRPLGDFRLLREIGRGGMGVVYEATQLFLGRRVAVKILPMAAALDARHLQRFRNEAQAAAQLHHSNIVPVYAVGCERSVHFYAMQLIDGQSLSDVIGELRAARNRGSGAFDSSTAKPGDNTTWAPSSEIQKWQRQRIDPSNSDNVTLDGHIPAPQKPGGNLSTLHSSKRMAYFRAVAKLGLQAAEALYYAHQQGVVHRDIKPANLLLDTQGTLWITDFGLAQIYADTGLTQTGDVLGTFRYMSPEQASGRAVVLDQRTDIYSLGITLYEMLTLERALPGVTREELMHQITSVDPKSPRTIDKKIPAELETIISKATAKDATERYHNAQALADDLQRFLDDQPVLARRPSLVNRAIKWTRRHKTIAYSALVILLLGTIGSTLSSVLIAREQSKTKAGYLRELRRAEEANEQRRLAEKSFDQAREAIDFLTTTAIQELPSDPKLFQVRWRLLETSLAFYQSFLDQRKDDPSLTRELNAAEAQINSVLAELAAVDELLRTNFEIRLLSERGVQEDLALSSQQVTDAEKMSVQIGSKPPISDPDSSQLTSQQVREATAKDTAWREAALTGVLTPAQSKRLHQISRQIRGVFAFSDADVAAALVLTPAQKHAVRSACADFHNHHHHGPPKPGTVDTEREDMQKTVTDVLAQLTPQQAATWNAMTGQLYSGNAPPYELWFLPQRHGHGPNGHDGMGDHGPDDHGGPNGHHPPDDDAGPPHDKGKNGPLKPSEG